MTPDLNEQRTRVTDEKNIIGNALSRPFVFSPSVLQEFLQSRISNYPLAESAALKNPILYFLISVLSA